MEQQWGMAPAAPPTPAYEPATDPMYAPAVDLSYQQPYVPPAPDPGYGADSSIYAPAPDAYTPTPDPYSTPPNPYYSEPMQDPWAQMAYQPASYVNNSGAILPGSLDSWESPANFTENEAFSTISGNDIGGGPPPWEPAPAPAPGFYDPSMDQQFGWNGTGDPNVRNLTAQENWVPFDQQEKALGVADPGYFGQPRFNNPQFATSNAQFDATTDPNNPNRYGVGINQMMNTDLPFLTEASNAVGDAGAFLGSQVDKRFMTGGYGEKTGRFIGDSIVPNTFSEMGMALLGGDLAPASEFLTGAGRQATEGFGGALLGSNLDTIGKTALDKLPNKVLQGAARRFPEAPGVGADIARLVREAGGGAADDVSKWLDQVAIDSPDAAGFIAQSRKVQGDAATAQAIANQAVPGLSEQADSLLKATRKELRAEWEATEGIGQKATARQILEDSGNGDLIVDTQKNGINLAKTKDAWVEARISGTANPIGAAAPAAEDAAGLAARTPEPMRKALNLSGQAGDPVDDITEQILRDAEGWPVATPGSQAGLFDEPVQGFMEQAAGPTSYMPGPKAIPEGLTLEQQRLNAGLGRAGGNFDPNAATPESGFLRNESTTARMQSAEGPANYAPGNKVDAPEVSLQQRKLAKAATENPGNLERGATAPDSGFMQGQPTTPAMQSAPGPAKYEWQAVPELEVPLRQQVLIKAAKENPSTSTLTPLVEEIFKGKLGQQAFDINVARANKPLWSQAIDEAIALTGLPRELKASFDLSIPGRQGLALAFRHPLEWFDSWKTVLPSLGSENGFKIVNQDAENLITKWRQVAGDGVVHLNTIDRTAKGTERIAGFEAAGDNFASRLSAKLGTGKFERSAVAFINHQRATTMDTMFTAIQKTTQKKREALRAAGNADPAALAKIAHDEARSYRNIAAIIDHATGYGGAPLKGDLMSRLLFSQRFMTSRFQYLVDPVVEGLARGDMNAARAATENLVAFAGGSATLLALIDAGAEKAGVDALDVGWDPRSSDFGKIRIGPARIDFGAGFLPLLRSAAQIGTGERATLTGDIIPIQKFDADTFKKESRVKASGNVALSFFRNKLDPMTQELVSRAFYGTDPVGNKPTQLLSTQTLENMFAPLLLSSTLESMRQGASPGATAALAGSEFFGGSSSTYGQGQAAQQDIAQQKYGVDYSKLPSQYQAQINAEAIQKGVDVDIGSRLAPWWDSRNDAVEYYKSQIAPGQESDPRIAAALEATSYQDLGQRLQMVYENEYNMTRTQAEKEVTKTLDAMVGENVDAYRKDIAAADPGFAKAWLDAYNARETKYKPPVWVQELAEGK